MSQSNLFTSKKCDYCGKSLIGRHNPNLFDGFRDADTKQLVCFGCKAQHYIIKSKTHPGLYSEVPEMI